MVLFGFMRWAVLFGLILRLQIVRVDYHSACKGQIEIMTTCHLTVDIQIGQLFENGPHHQHPNSATRNCIRIRKLNTVNTKYVLNQTGIRDNINKKVWVVH